MQKKKLLMTFGTTLVSPLHNCLSAFTVGSNLDSGWI